VLALDDATYQSISITAWMAANPDPLLSTNFGVPESMFVKFPKVALFMPE
jgi:oxalate decarboxylase